MPDPSVLVDTHAQPIASGQRRRHGDTRFGAFVQRYWSIIMVAGGVIGSFVLLQERTAENARRNAETAARVDKVENQLQSMATKADLKRVEDGVTFLVQREMTKAAK
jgi:hypothetical protein